MTDGMELLRRGQWGFTFQVPATFANPGGFSDALLSTNATEGIDRYTVVLNAMRYSSGFVLASAQPLDNQVDTRFAMTMQWGCNGASDQCEVDYPCRGGSFTVAAEYLRIQVFRDATGPSIGPPPILSGYITPTQKLLGALVPPTRSRTVTLATPGATFLQAIPPRATAYRLWVSPNSATLASVNQMQGDGVSLAMSDGVVVNGNFEDTLQENRSSYRPLNPTATFLLLTNGSVASTTYVQYLLDLG